MGTMSEAIGAPSAPSAAAAAASALGRGRLSLAPVRHHSPACSLALLALLEEKKPESILIEGPVELNALLPLLSDGRCRPPIAAFCKVADSDGEPRSAFYPFCDYSPEWVAMRYGASRGIRVAFIDESFAGRRDGRRGAEGTEGEGEGVGPAARSLLEESWMAHAAYSAALAARLGCRDWNEAWDRLFELRGKERLSDWRSLFGELAAYCGIVRLEYGDRELEAEGSASRERCMAEAIERELEAAKGEVVAVVGGFHAPGILELLDRGGAIAEAPVKGAAAKGAAAKNAAAAKPRAELWLLRYGFAQLDALSGYGAGMSAPGYYQRLWERRDEGEERHLAAVLDALEDFAERLASRAGLFAVSTADLIAAAAQASRLASLRGLPGPGREELKDAARSCFLKESLDEAGPAFGRALDASLAGERLGDVPPSAGSPPILEDARARARAARVSLDTSARKSAKLDIRRSPRHRERSVFFRRMAYLGTGFCEWKGGPDFSSGTGLDLRWEEWSYTWGPFVEGRLLELATRCSTLAEAVSQAFAAESEALRESALARSSEAWFGLFLKASLLGMDEELGGAAARAAAVIAEDPAFASVSGAAWRAALLWRSREAVVESAGDAASRLASVGFARSIELAVELSGLDEDAEDEAIGALLALRETASILVEGGSSAREGEAWRGLLGELASRDGLPALAGAAAALSFLDGSIGEGELGRALALRFGVGAEASDSLRFLVGLAAAAPELPARLPVVVESLNALILGWEDEEFESRLPDLRRAFCGLAPAQTLETARRARILNGGSEEEEARSAPAISEEELRLCLAVDRILGESLRREGIESLFAEGGGR